MQRYFAFETLPRTRATDVFFEARRKAIEPIHFAIQEKLTEFQTFNSTALNLHVPSAASVLIALIERTAVVVLLPSAHKATRPRQIEVVAFYDRQYIAW